MPKVLLTGATGLIGSALGAACARDGWTVAALVRNASRAARLVPNAVLHPWDATQGSPPEGAFDGVDVVVNLMGESIGDGRWTDKQKKRLRDSRIVGTRALVDGMRGLERRPRLLISASGAGYYGNRGDEILTESSPPGTGFLADLARDWEAEAAKAAELGVKVAIVRNGLVMSRSGGVLGRILTPFRLGVGGRIGDGRQWFPWIHLEDEIGLIRHLMNQGMQGGPEGGRVPHARPSIEGVFNAVAPEPVTNRELTSALGEILNRPTIMTAPAFALRLALGGDRADQLLLTSQRVMPVRTLETGYTFRHPLLRAALRDLMGRETRDQEQPAPSPTA